MIGLSVPSSVDGRPFRILCIGAHCDDIEIGCGGTLLHMQASGQKPIIDWIVLTGEEARQTESRSAMELLVNPTCRGDLLFGGFPDSRLPTVYGAVKEFFSSLRGRPRPDMIFCHYRDDAHQDHRLVSEVVWGAYRDHLVLEYEIVKWDGDLGRPNAYVPLEREILDRKLEVLMGVYGSQRGKDWFTEDTFLAMSRLRGVECRSPSGHAEAFHVRKFVLSR